MQQSRRTTQRLHLVVLSIPLHRSQPVDTRAQRVIVPICRRGVATANR
ncbi:MAG TPA: hypothetical protein VIY29_12550 [Ktedonobacteraceae bacterium]